MIDPRAVADRHPDPVVRALARLTVIVTERPWAVTSRDLAHARADGLDDNGVLHAILQTSLFGHLNRIADAVGVDADYPDAFGAPHVEPATPPYLWPSSSPPDIAGPIQLSSRAGAVDLVQAWRAYVLDRDAAVNRRERELIAHAVAVRLGDSTVPRMTAGTPREAALVELADVVTLAPWRLGPAAYAAIRAVGLAGDVDVFDAVATASSCTVFSRISVALAGFGRD